MIRVPAPTRRTPPQGGPIVFDCDGVLLDTESCWRAGEATLFSRYGRPFGERERRMLFGTSLAEAGRCLERLLDQAGRAAELAAELHDLVAEGFAYHARPRLGAKALVFALFERDRPLAVATNTPTPLVQDALDYVGLRGAFHAVIGADLVSFGKPAPDVYREACAQLGSAPSWTIAIEDSAVGVQSALAAGLYVIGVPSLTRTRLTAHVVAPSLRARTVWTTVGLGKVVAS